MQALRGLVNRKEIKALECPFALSKSLKGLQWPVVLGPWSLRTLEGLYEPSKGPRILDNALLPFRLQAAAV